MDRAIWIERLAELVRPRSPAGAANRMTAMLGALGNEPLSLFNEDSLVFVAGKLKRTPNYAELKLLLDQYARQHSPEGARPPPDFGMPERQQDRDARAWEQRQAWLRQDWDNPDAILRKVADCRGNVLMLRLLAKIVRQWAPQHLGYLPPRIIAAIEDDAEVPAADRHLRFDDGAPPDGTRSIAEQLAELVPPGEPQPRHLTPEDLDQLNPLPNGRKRA